VPASNATGPRLTPHPAAVYTPWWVVAQQVAGRPPAEGNEGLAPGGKPNAEALPLEMGAPAVKGKSARFRAGAFLEALLPPPGGGVTAAAMSLTTKVERAEQTIR